MVPRDIVVLGKKPRKDGTSPEIQIRIEKALEVFDKGYGERIIISGGSTRRNVDSEARLGERYIHDILRRDVPVLLEDRSRSTAENILFLKAKFESTISDRLIVVVGPHEVKRARVLFRSLWPDKADKIDFVAAGTSSVFDIIEESLLLPFAMISPQETIFPVPLLKKIFRNG